MASSEGVPQGGVLSPLLSNIMLHEFDAWLEAKYLNRKARKDPWAWNFGIQQGRSITVRENRQWNPAIAYCRYADDFVVIFERRGPIFPRSSGSAAQGAAFTFGSMPDGPALR